MLDKVRSQPYVTFVGVPGSGKTATASHIAFQLQKEGYEILPIRDIKHIDVFCDRHNPQVFVIDNVIGVFGLDSTALNVLDSYKDIIEKPKMPKTKILMTCRETVFRDKTLSTSFLSKQENTIFLNSKENELTDGDKHRLLTKYGLKENLLTQEDLASTSKMFPYLCKHYSKEQDLKSHGPAYFKSPTKYLLKELNDMKTGNKIQYASLVLLMANQNKLSKHMFENETYGPHMSHELKRKILSLCEVSSSTHGFHFIDALTAMEGTYTKKLCVNCESDCDCEFAFINESMFEITVYHFGCEFGDFILENMGKHYVVSKIKLYRHDQETRKRKYEDVPRKEQNKKENEIDLCISLPAAKIHLLAEKLFNDVEKGELYKVFVSEVWKCVPVMQAFTELIEKKAYNELHSVFLSELTRTSEVRSIDMVLTHSIVSSTTLNVPPPYVQRCILKLLNDENTGMFDKKGVRAVSWVVYFGHHQILKSIIKKIKQEKGKLDDLFQNSYNSCTNYDQNDTDTEVESVTEVVGSVEPVIVEQSRLLCLGCASGDLDTVQMLLKHIGKEAINNRTQRHQYNTNWDHMPLTIACYFGYLNIVSELLKEGANVNSFNLFIPPLVAACEFHGNAKIVKLLIDNGAEINSLFHSSTALAHAVEFKSWNAVDVLLEARIDVNLGISCRKPLTIACKRGYLNVVKQLIIAGSEVNPSTPSVMPTHSEVTVDPREIDLELPLTAACCSGHFSVVQELIKSGADVNKLDKLVTPLAAACSGGHLKVIKLLLKERAYKTELHNVHYARHTGVILKLIRLGIDVNVQNTNEKSLLAACARGQPDLVREIIKDGADVNFKDEEKTPLIVACYFGHLNVVKVLIKAGAAVDLQNGFITPLQVASYEGQPRIVLELIKGGADVNLKYKEVTALAAACYFGHVDVVKELKKAGADVNQTSYHKTPQQIAKYNSYYDVFKELNRRGTYDDPMQELWR